MCDACQVPAVFTGIAMSISFLEFRQQVGIQQVDSVLVAVDAAALHARRHGSGSSPAAQRAPDVAGAAGADGDGGQNAYPGNPGGRAQPATSAWPTMPQVSLYVQCL
jgi:hypothetical protein